MYDTRTRIGKMLQRNGFSTRLYSANFGTEYKEASSKARSLHSKVGDSDFHNLDYFKSLSDKKIEKLEEYIRKHGQPKLKLKLRKESILLMEEKSDEVKKELKHINTALTGLTEKELERRAKTEKEWEREREIENEKMERLNRERAKIGTEAFNFKEFMKNL